MKIIKFFNTIVSFLLWKIVPKSFWATVYASYMKDYDKLNSSYICDKSNLFYRMWNVRTFSTKMQIEADEFLAQDSYFQEYRVGTDFKYIKNNVNLLFARREDVVALVHAKEVRKAFLEHIISKL